MSAAAFLMVDTVHRGYLDAFAPIAFVVSLFWALIGSVVVGLVFNVVRRSHSDVTLTTRWSGREMDRVPASITAARRSTRTLGDSGHTTIRSSRFGRRLCFRACGESYLGVSGATACWAACCLPRSRLHLRNCRCFIDARSGLGGCVGYRLLCRLHSLAPNVIYNAVLFRP